MALVAPGEASDWGAKRWSLLASFEVDRRQLTGMYGLGECVPDGDRPGCPGGAVCVGREYRVAPLHYPSWPACPLSLLADGKWQAIIRTWNASLVSPLSAWPYRYAAWLVDGVEALRGADDRKKARQLKGGGKGGGGTVGAARRPTRGKGF